MNTVLKTFLAASLLTLAACGGGGKSNDAASRPNPNNTPTVKVPLTGLSVHTEIREWGGGGVSPSDKANVREINHTGHINSLTVDGKTIELVPQHYGDKIYRYQDKFKGLTIGNNLQYARYGWYGYTDAPAKDGMRDWNTAWFYQGQATPEQTVAAAKGKAVYTGQSLSSQSDSRARLQAFAGNTKHLLSDIVGTATVHVDFDNKTFTAKVQANDSRFAEMPAVSGEIEGNRLRGYQEAGAAKHAFGGHFFGPNAEEAAGMYSFQNIPGKNASGVEVLGTFGVKKQ